MATKVFVNSSGYNSGTGNINASAILFDDTTGIGIGTNMLKALNLTGMDTVGQITSALVAYWITQAANAGYTVTTSDFIWAETASVDSAFVAAAIAAKMPYSRYAALITQTGTSAPMNTDEINDFTGTTFTWARTSAGVYTVTASTAVFTSGKTIGIFSPLTNLNGALSIVRTSSTVITITTAVQSLAVLGLLSFTATPTDALLSANLFEFRVYN